MCALDPRLDPDLETAGCGDAGGPGELMMENSTGVQRPPLQDKLLPVGAAAEEGRRGATCLKSRETEAGMLRAPGGTA